MPSKDHNSAKPLPLEGLQVLLTRPQHQNGKLGELLSELGAHPIFHPVIRIEPVTDEAGTRKLQSLADFSRIAILSRNAATAFADQIRPALPDLPNLPPIVAIGTGTQTQLEQAGFVVALCPPQANSLSLGQSLIEEHRDSKSTQPILIVRADRGSDELSTLLREADVAFEELAVYRSTDVEEVCPDTLQSVANGSVDWITLTSSAIAKNVGALFGDAIRPGQPKLVSISSRTTTAAIEAGLQVTATATEASLDGIVQAIVEFEN